MNKNYSVRCDVKKCAHNVGGLNCRLNCVKITCGADKSTRCDDYSEE